MYRARHRARRRPLREAGQAAWTIPCEIMTGGVLAFLLGLMVFTI